MGSSESGAPAIVAPKVPDGLTEVDGSVVGDGEMLDRVVVSGDGDVGDCTDLSVTESRLSGLRLTGVTWDESVLLDTVVAGCELSGATLSGARWERVELTGCRMSGLVASELRGRHLRFVDCKMDEAWLRAAVLDHVAFEGCDLTGADLLGARLTNVRFVDCRLDGAELTSVWVEGTVAIHGSTFEGTAGLADLHGLVIGHDQVLPIALPLLAAHNITIDDDYLDAHHGANEVS
jgi:Pentapeptide repeats (8 copies)